MKCIQFKFFLFTLFRTFSNNPLAPLFQIHVICLPQFNRLYNSFTTPPRAYLLFIDFFATTQLFFSYSFLQNTFFRLPTKVTLCTQNDCFEGICRTQNRKSKSQRTSRTNWPDPTRRRSRRYDFPRPNRKKKSRRQTTHVRIAPLPKSEWKTKVGLCFWEVGMDRRATFFFGGFIQWQCNGQIPVWRKGPRTVLGCRLGSISIRLTFDVKW